MTVQQLQERITANSNAWHQTQDQREKTRLHEENVELYAQMDGLTGQTSDFNSASGRWSSSAAGSGDYQGVSAPEVKDLSGLVETRQKAALDQTLLNLERAYTDSVQSLKRERQAIGGAYQAARNNAAAVNEIEKVNANTYAAGKGLNSGAAGQIALSQSVAYQNGINTLNAQEANAYAENEEALSEMERDYNFAVAEAKAEGDYALADALYAEQSRFDQAQRQAWRDSEDQNREIYQLNRENRRYDTQQLLNAQQTAYDQQWADRKWNYQVEQDALDRQEAATNTAWEQARLDRNDSWDREKELASLAISRQNANTSGYNAATSRMNAQLRVAQELAGVGNFEGFRALGYTQGQVENMEAMWKEYMDMK